MNVYWRNIPAVKGDARTGAPLGIVRWPPDLPQLGRHNRLNALAALAAARHAGIPVAAGLAALTGFEWDEGNSEKSWRAHAVTRAEAEEAFGNAPVVVAEDVPHSQDEPRLTLLGRTNAGRHLFVAFTVRESRVRVISVRSMSRRERRRYDEARSAEA